ncbi:hypothetical protein KCU85_g200, partial [Aureobasidium melanogenum]
MTLCLFVRIAVDKPIDTASTNGGSGDTTALFSSPWSRFLAGSESLDSTSNKSSLSSLSPLAFGASLGSAAAAAIVVRVVATTMTSHRHQTCVVQHDGDEGVSILPSRSHDHGGHGNGGDPLRVQQHIQRLQQRQQRQGHHNHRRNHRSLCGQPGCAHGEVEGRREVSCDVFDAFLARAVDQITRRRAFAALDVGSFLDKFGIAAFARSSARLAVAAAVVVSTVVGHVKMMGVTSLTRVASRRPWLADGFVLLRDRAGKSERRAKVATSGLKTWQAKQQPTHQPCTQTSFEPAFSQPNQPTSDFCLSIQPVSQSKPLPGAIKSMISNRKWSTLLIIRDPARP